MLRWRLALAAALVSQAVPSLAQVSIALDATGDVKAIDPMIYGVSFAGDTPTLFTEMKYPANRWGGNSTTRYNWKLHSQNAAADWVFLSFNTTPHDVEFSASVLNGSAQLVTIPMLGWVSRADGNKLCSYPVDAFPNQDPDVYGRVDYDSRNVMCGSGFRGGKPIGLTDTQKALANVAVDVSFATDWIAQIRSSWPAVHHYALDNEPTLWNSTHFDMASDAAGSIRQIAATDFWAKTVAYATAIKQADPQAKVFGPVHWGWCAYFGGNASTADLGGCTMSTDAVAWYLDQVKAYHDAHGVLLVDYLDLHFYPGGAEYGGGEDTTTAALRLRSVKDLYDPAYDNESWMADLFPVTTPPTPKAVKLIPRMKQWIADHAPGLGIKTAITEYNWGQNDGITAALAQAEILSIFARQGLDAGYRWTTPGSSQPMTQDAFRMYLNYDGAGGKVVGSSIGSTSSAVDTVAGYGVVSGSNLFVALFNKSTSQQTAAVALQHATLSGATGSVWGFSQSERWGLRGSVAPTSTTAFSLSLPARSARLVRLPLATGAVTCNNDGVCGAGENHVTCPNDCPAPTCNNDGVCDSWESTATCPNDCPANPCNNNGVCEAGESASNCPADCPAWQVTASAPATLQVGAAATITAHARNNGATASGYVQVYLHGPGIAAGIRNCASDTQTVSLAGSGATTDCAASWTPTQAGTYTVAAGVFSAGWGSLLWVDNLATITVSASTGGGGGTGGGSGTPSGGSLAGNVKGGCSSTAGTGGLLLVGALLLGVRRRRRA